MSPAAKSKSKSMSNKRSSVNDPKDQQNTSSKLSGSTLTGNDNSTGARISMSGMFHALDTSPVTSSPPLHNNGRFKNIGEPVEHFNFLHGTTADFDSLSNNGSCSGESEDHKEKVGSTTHQPETVPGCDNEKREKIRQKNERKHQRQRERRSKELHDRCCGYLVSRKLEALSQQLVAMGFSSERATLALMLNEGKLEESVAWLFEASEEEAQKKDFANGSNLKIDVSQELVRITTMESKYNCSKQEVERVVIACEGDLDEVEETLRMQKLESPVTPPKQEQTAILRHSIGPQGKASVTTQVSRSDRDFNHSKEAGTLLTFPEVGSRNLQLLNTNLPVSLVEKNWLAKGSSSSLTYSMGLPMQVAPSSLKLASQCNNGGVEGRNIQPGEMQEPVTMMQRPKSINIKQNPITVSNASSGAAGWYTNNVLGSDRTNTNGKLSNNQTIGSLGGESLSLLHLYPQTQISRSTGSDRLSLQQHNPQTGYVQRVHMSSSMDPSTARLSSMRSTTGSSSPSLTVPSSLGLFSGWGSTGTLGSTPRVDWNTGDMMSHCDYNSIDWSLQSNSSSLKSSGLMPWKSGGLMLGLSSTNIPSKNGMCVPRLVDGGMAPEMSSSAGSKDWTSPFAGKDIFSAPRQFVSSPSP